MSNLNSADIDAVCRLVDDLCGICWDESKSYLIESRLAALSKQNNCENYRDLVRKVRAEIVPGLKEQVVDAVTTNETLWFRDNSPFEALRYKTIPELMDEKASGMFPKSFRVWSAACSTGQEPYSIAIAFADTLYDFEQYDIQIFATDISPSAVEQANEGVYSELEIGRGMDPDHLNKHFVKHDKGWKIHERIRSMCSFQTLNLHDPFAIMGHFDIIFCRNVAIYFTAEAQRTLFEKLASVLTPTGWIFTGSAESLSSLGEKWVAQQHCGANCYRPNMAPVPRT